MTEDGPLPTGVDVEEKPLVRRKLGGRSLIEIWTAGAQGAEAALRSLETLQQMLTTLRRHAIAQTYAEDWVIHATKDRDDNITQQVGYLQDVGAQRAGKMFGIEIEQPKVEREDLPDKTFVYVVKASAYSRVTHEFIDYVEGSRWSGDDFFMRAIERAQAAGEEPPRLDPTDVRKAAYANLHGRAVRQLAGLSAVPLEVLKEAGIDVTRCRFVGYQAGAKGGTSAGAQTGTAELVMRFGRSRGKKLSELTDQDLGWYVEAYRRDVADQAKAQHRQANQRILDQLLADQERRQRTASQPGSSSAPAGDQGAGEERPPQREEPGGAGGGTEDVGTKRGTFWTRIGEACTVAAVPKGVSMLVLKQVTKEVLGRDIRGLSDIATMEEVDKLLGIATPELLVRVAKSIAEQEKKK